jgi:hypothetical protein
MARIEILEVRTLLSTWTVTSAADNGVLPVDRYFAANHTEGFRVTTPRLDRAEWNEGNGLGFDLVLMDDRLVG